MSQVNITPGISHGHTRHQSLVTVISHLFTQLNRAEPIWVTEGCLWYEGMSTWWLMVSGRDTIWQGLSTCVNPTCVTCSMSVSTCQTGSRTSDPSHLKYNLGLTIILTKEENRDTSLPRYRDNGNTWSGLSRHLSLCSILPEDIKVSILSCPILCVRTQSIEPLCLFLLKYINGMWKITYSLSWLSTGQSRKSRKLIGYRIEYHNTVSRFRRSAQHLFALVLPGRVKYSFTLSSYVLSKIFS